MDAAVAALHDAEPAVPHVAQFNVLLREWLPTMVRTYAPFDTLFETAQGDRERFTVGVHNVRLVRQDVLPRTAHQRNLNYAFDVLADLHLQVVRLPCPDAPAKPGRKRKRPAVAAPTGGPVLLHEARVDDHLLFSFPCMLGSDLCTTREARGLRDHDLSGTFILRGKARFVPFKQRKNHNEPFLNTNSKDGFDQCEVRSEHLDRKHRSTSTLFLRLTHPRRAFKAVSQALKTVAQGRQLEVTWSFLGPAKRQSGSVYVPLHLLVLALGSTWDAFERMVLACAPPEARLAERAEGVLLRARLAPRMTRGRGRAAGTGAAVQTQRDAFKALAAVYQRRDREGNEDRLLASLRNTVESEVFPHLNAQPAAQVWPSKVCYLAWVSSLLLRYHLGDLDETDRDSWQYASLDGAGDLLAQLFRQRLIEHTTVSVKNLRRLMRQREKPPKRLKAAAHAAPSARAAAAAKAAAAEAVRDSKEVDLAKLYNANRLTPKLMSAMSTGRWSDKREGMSHPLKVTNGRVLEAQLRRVSSHMLGNQGKQVEPRMIHPSSYGFLCAAESPEGEPCGLVFPLALTACVALETDVPALTRLTERVLGPLLVPLAGTVDPPDPHSWKLVDGHGVWRGWLTDHRAALARLRALRRRRAVDATVSFVAVEAWSTLFVRASPGRICRPLWVAAHLDRLPALLQARRARRPRWDDLLQHGLVEYVDTAEAASGPETCRVAFDPRDLRTGVHTHLELTHVSFLGLCAAAQPYFRMNQGPRLVYQVGMSKQFIEPGRFDDHGASIVHTLQHGQRALVRSAWEAPNTCDGFNLLVGLTAHPLAQEDAIVLNRATVDRGAGHTVAYRVYTATQTPRNANLAQDRFEKPDPATTVGLKMPDYRSLGQRLHGRPDMDRDPYAHIGPDGMPRVGARLQPGDVVIGKTIPYAVLSPSAKVRLPPGLRGPDLRDRQDASVLVRKDEQGTVDRVVRGPGIVKVVVRTLRIPERGDKFTNRHGQKGTVGHLEAPENMPFDEATGMPLDAIVGPTSMPSRMTVGMLLEMLVGQAVAVSGDLGLGVDAQDLFAHAPDQVHAVGEVLRRYGVHPEGLRWFRDGKTGRRLQCQLFAGPLFYGKMDHMVSRKVHARARGPMQAKTRQPNEGRAKDGGFRMGNMQFDALTAHGAARLLQERSTGVSDEIKMYRCGQCGFPADANPAIGLYMCRHCQTSKHIRTLRMANSASIVLTELAADGISTRFILQDEDLNP